MNELWRSLGLEGKRAIIIHHDDLGLTHAQEQAYERLGLPTGSVMVPGPWAPRPRQGDLGVHVTLTSEWPAPRLRPLTGGASLRDAAGYLPATLEAAWRQLDPGEAAAEMRAQLEAALALGIDVTHLDTHMGAVLRPDLAAAYHSLAVEHRLPALLPDEASYEMLPEPFRQDLVALCERSPLPRLRIVDGYHIPPAERKAWYCDTLSRLGPGLYHLIHHAAVPTDEGRALADWEGRQADLEALQDPDVRRVLAEFVLITYRDVRDALRRVM
ncbi:carbohydrate deacetylase [Symbiobacterium terraclitae]|uniref:carbohydrate deacetylase n=1 Tax=Symbiobacterium terraclitae TaxID=557451 RepID=UPI0035B51818